MKWLLIGFVLLVFWGAWQRERSERKIERLAAQLRKLDLEIEDERREALETKLWDKVGDVTIPTEEVGKALDELDRFKSGRRERFLARLRGE